VEQPVRVLRRPAAHAVVALGAHTTTALEGLDGAVVNAVSKQPQGLGAVVGAITEWMGHGGKSDGEENLPKKHRRHFMPAGGPFLDGSKGRESAYLAVLGTQLPLKLLLR